MPSLKEFLKVVQENSVFRNTHPTTASVMLNNSLVICIYMCVCVFIYIRTPLLLSASSKYLSVVLHIMSFNLVHMS